MCQMMLGSQRTSGLTDVVAENECAWPLRGVMSALSRCLRECLVCHWAVDQKKLAVQL